MQSMKTCVLGAGRMGSAIVRTLLASGTPTWVYNRTPAKAEALAALGAKIAPTVEDGLRAADLILVNVLDYAVSDTLLKHDGFAPLLNGKTVVQLTSGSPRLARKEARWFEGHGAQYLDGAIMATPDFIGRPEAALLYSGSRAAFDAHETLLRRLGGGTTYVGEVAGQASALDTALLTQMWGGLFGALQGMAVVGAEAIGLDTFETQLAAFKPVVDAAIADLITRTKAKRFASDEETLASLGVHYGAFKHLFEACHERGLDAALPKAMDHFFVQALAEHGPDVDLAALAPLFQKPVAKPIAGA